MSETLLLVIFAIVITLAIFLIKRQVSARQAAGLNKKVELGIRILLTLLAAVIAHALYRKTSLDSLGFWLAVAANCLILYAVTHMADRVLLKG